MPRIPGLRRVFHADTGAPRIEREVDDELRFHFDSTVDDLVRQGWTIDAARDEAVRRFGDVERTRATLRRIDRGQAGQRRRAEWWQAVAQDVRYALRGMRAAPGFTAVVMLTLALGIGASATMFGIVDRLLLRGPAYLAAPGETVKLYFTRNFNGVDRTFPNTTYKTYAELRATNRSFAELAAFADLEDVVGTGDAARERRVGRVSASLWRLFDARPQIGRFFTAEEDRTPTGAPVAVLGWGYWQSAYGGKPDVLGQTIQIAGVRYTIVGVTPRGFNGMSRYDLAAFVPITTAANDQFGEMYYTTHNITWLTVFGRLKPGVGQAAADADLTRAFRQSWAERLGKRLDVQRPRARVASVIEDRGPNRGQSAKVAIWLVGVAAVLLAIACANVANLLLARALRRRREIALRIALGAGRARLLALLLTESVLLAAGGALVGVLLAIWGGGLVRATLLPDFDWSKGTVDARLLGFALVVALVTGLATGVAPAVQARKTELTDALKSGGREGGVHRSRMRATLLIAQGALSVVLLVGAGLFVRSLHNVSSLDLGFDARHLMYVGIETRGEKIDTTARHALVVQMIERARTLPAVANATITESVPFWMTWDEVLFVPGVDTARLRPLEFSLNAVDSAYFPTTGTRIVRGRAIGAGDVKGAPLVTVVSESMARTIWPQQDAIGKCVRVGADTAPCRTVVGVARDNRRSFEAEPMLQYYMASQQRPLSRGSGLFVRTRGDAAQAVEAVRRELQKVMPGASYATARSLESIIDPEIRPWRLGATMFLVFGALALLVAMVGLYSVLAYDVAQRTHELGVRVALGARAADVVRLVVGDGLRLIVVAIALGTGAALVAGRWVAPLLYDVSPKDPLTLGVVTGVLVLVALGASLVPAMRASRVDPARALKAD